MYEVTLINDDEKTTIHSPYFDDVKLQSGEINIDINVANGFSFSFLPNQAAYNIVRPLKTLVKVFNHKTGEYDFEGRILMPTESMSESGEFGKSFVCEDELAYLNDSTQRHGEYHDISVKDFLKEIIDNHNADVADDDIDKTFEVGIVEVDSSTSTVYRYLGYDKTFDTIKDKLIDRLGGELRVRKEDGVRYLDYLKSAGERKSTEIRLAKNLKSLSKESDPTEIITRLIPLGESIESDNEQDTDASQKRLTIESVNDGKDYIDDKEAMAVFGIITKSEKWDDITQANRLLTSGKNFLKENNRIKTKYQITALDLSLIDLDVDSFDVGNYYPVINEVMGIDKELRIVKKTINILEPENSSLDIGDKFMTASEYQKEANKSRFKIADLEEVTSRQSKRLSEVREEMTNANHAIERINEALGDADVGELEQAVGELHKSVEGLQEAVGNIPDYEIATEEKDGLISKENIQKINNITVSNSIDLDDISETLSNLKDKLDFISVNEEINLDQLKQDVDDLKNSNREGDDD